MKVGSHHILVKIDKSAQLQKREKIGQIYIPPQFLYMKFNLQYGEVLQVGSLCQKKFPDIEPGDTLFFHHTVEQNEWRLVHEEANGDEWRVLDAYLQPDQVFGVAKKETLEVIPNPNWIFLQADTLKKHKEKLKSKLIDTESTDDEMFEDQQYLQTKINQITTHQKSLGETMRTTSDPYKFEEIEREIRIMNKEKEKLSQLMHNPPLYQARVAFINPDVAKTINVNANNSILTEKNILYPVSYDGVDFLLVNTNNIWAVLN